MKIRTELYVFMLVIAFGLGSSIMFIARSLYHPQPVKAFLIDPIDPTVATCDNQGNCTVYKVPGSLSLPANSTVIYTGTSLSKTLEAVQDNLFAGKNTQAILYRDGPEPIPLCDPWPKCNGGSAVGK